MADLCRVSSEDRCEDWVLLDCLVGHAGFFGHLSENDSSNEDLYYTGFFIYQPFVGTEEIPQTPLLRPSCPGSRPAPQATGAGGAPAPRAYTRMEAPTGKAELSRPGVPCRAVPPWPSRTPRPKDTDRRGCLVGSICEGEYSPNGGLATRINHPFRRHTATGLPCVLHG